MLRKLEVMHDNSCSYEAVGLKSWTQLKAESLKGPELDHMWTSIAHAVQSLYSRPNEACQIRPSQA